MGAPECDYVYVVRQNQISCRAVGIAVSNCFVAIREQEWVLTIYICWHNSIQEGFCEGIRSWGMSWQLDSIAQVQLELVM